MLVVPLVLGIVASGPTWIHLPLAVLWFLGYLDFFAVGLWLKSRRQARYLQPARTYSLILVVPAVVVLVLQPGLLVWAAAYAPLVAVSLWRSHQRAERSLANDLVTVFAACLILPVAFDAGISGGVGANATGWSQVWAMFVVVLGYFVGTVLYVKTLIREKGRRGYLVASVVYHVLAIVAVAGVLALADLRWKSTAVLFTLLAVRAIMVPRTGARPIQIGLGEVLASAVLMVCLLTA